MNKKSNSRIPLFSILLILLITIIATSTKPAPIELTIPESPILEIPTVQQVRDSIVETTPTPSPTETPYPKPSYIPTLRPMDCYDKSHDIWHPCNPSSYITPDNEWVRYYASQLFVDYDGRIKYKNEKIIYYTINGIDYHTYKPFLNNYVTLKEYFGYEVSNDDYWMMPDYYLYNGQRGICSGWMVAVTSMMLSGEISVWQGDKLVKQIIPAKAVLGYMEDKRDGWVEYQVYNKKFLTSTAREIETITGNKMSQTWFLNESDELFKLYKPVFEFTDKYFRRV